MLPLRLDAEQRFTCSQCGRCCRRPWEVVVTPAEAEAYRKANAARWFRAELEGAEGVVKDPFEPIPGTLRFHRIRKRSDGACGFLSPGNRCRLHEELGARRKPLSCRMFPYRFHPLEGAVAVTTDFCCPTTVANAGEAIKAQLGEIKALQAEWFAVYPEKPRSHALVKGRRMDAATLATLREVLGAMLDRPGPDGRPDLRANVRRMARSLEDLSRHRVVRLADAAFAEYLTLTGRFAAASEKPVEPKRLSAVSRLLQRGFLFLVAATRLQVENKSASGWRLGLRLRLFRLLAHFHGLGPGIAGIDLRAARRLRVDLQQPELHALAYHYLRSSLQTLGTGRRPVLDELAIAVSYLNAACALAAMRALEASREAEAPCPVDRAIFTDALMEAVDLTHADDRGILGRILASFAGGVDALYAFAG